MPDTPLARMVPSKGACGIVKVTWHVVLEGGVADIGWIGEGAEIGRMGDAGNALGEHGPKEGCVCRCFVCMCACTCLFVPVRGGWGG